LKPIVPLLFALAGLASAGTVLVTGSGPCLPGAGVTGSGTTLVRLDAEVAPAVDIAGISCYVSFTAFFQADVLGAGTLHILYKSDPSVGFGSLSYFPASDVCSLTGCDIPFNSEIVFEIQLTSHTFIFQDLSYHYTDAGAELTATDALGRNGPITEVASLPEPSTLLLTLAGVAMLGWIVKGRNQGNPGLKSGTAWTAPHG
jgi:hypothetical protein